MGAGHVHDRPGRRAARRGHDDRRSAPRGLAGASSELLGSLRGTRAASREAASRRRPPTSRSSGSAASSPGAPDVATLWANILEKVDAITRDPGRALGLAADVRPRPEPPATRSTRAGAASSTRCRSIRSRSGCRRSRWSRSSRSSCSRCCAPRPRWMTPGYGDAAVRPRAHLGDPRRRRRRRRHLRRLHGPLGAAVAARRGPRRAAGAAVRAAPRVDRGQLRRDC